MQLHRARLINFFVISICCALYLGSTALTGESANAAAAPTFETWVNVTPAGVSLTNTLSCGNYGAEAIQVDPIRPSDLYTEFNCQGIWKSTNYGATWTGPINTGTNGAAVTDCAGGIAI